MTRYLTPATTIIAIGLYWLAVTFIEKNPPPNIERPPAVVVAEPLQVLLMAGDRFLAANIDTIRASASATTRDAELFSLHAHTAASRLNPCNEDNYWIGNATLSWGGAESQGVELLKNAIRCRYWDDWPAFFYGFNQYFFHHNMTEAHRGIEMAAERSATNAAAFKTFSIMLAAGEINDTVVALEMLKNERGKAKDANLREMLDKRVTRLEGLITLRNAQKEYEKRFGQPLTVPNELITSGILKAPPSDPLRIGYEFRDNTFHLLEKKIR